MRTGTGLPNSTSYCSVEEFESWCEGNLYAADALAETDERKQTALMMAAQTIDASIEYNGQRKTETQALGWPRDYAPQPGSHVSVMTLASLAPYAGIAYYPNDEVPKGFKDANCEMARQLLKSDRTDTDSSKRGAKKIGLGQGAIEIELDPADRQGLFTDILTMMLRPFGTILSLKQSMVPVERR